MFSEANRSLVQDIYMLHVTVTDYDSRWQVKTANYYISFM